MFSDDEKSLLGKVISEYQKEEKRKSDEQLERPEFYLRKHGIFLSFGLIVAGLGPLLTIMWQAFKYDASFHTMQTELVIAKRAVAVQEQQIAWLKSTVGNPNGRWTYSMEAFTLEALIQQNGLKPIDYAKIHDNLINYNMPTSEFPVIKKPSTLPEEEQ